DERSAVAAVVLPRLDREAEAVRRAVERRPRAARRAAASARLHAHVWRRARDGCAQSRRVAGDRVTGDAGAAREPRLAHPLIEILPPSSPKGGDMTGRFLAKSFLVLLVIVFIALPAAAQTATARIEGIVTDNTGAVLPGATVTATNTETNLPRIDVTNTQGAYTVTALKVGNYKVTVELSGFKTQTTPVTLTV